MPPMIVAPDRDTPGMSASVWHSPTPKARDDRRPLGILDVGRWTHLLDHQHHHAAGNEGGGKDGGALVQHALDEAGKQRAGDQRGNHRDGDRQREVPRVGARTEPGDDLDDLAPVQHHDRQNRTELDHHGEHAVRIGIAEQTLSETEVRRRRHGEKFRNPLEHAKERRLNGGGHAGLRAQGLGLRAQGVEPEP